MKIKIEKYRKRNSSREMKKNVIKVKFNKIRKRNLFIHLTRTAV